MRTRLLLFMGLLALAFVLVGSAPVAGQDRPASPEGMASTQIGGKWIDVKYSRPILRGRAGIFGSGDSYGTKVNGQGAQIWRVGADVTTRIKTELDLEIGGKAVPAGEYSFFIELKEGAWTAILSKQPFMKSFDRAKMQAGETWGAYGYNPEHDVVRAPMNVGTLEVSIDQVTILFENVTDDGGVIAVLWDNQAGSLPFKVK